MVLRQCPAFRSSLTTPLTPPIRRPPLPWTPASRRTSWRPSVSARPRYRTGCRSRCPQWPVRYKTPTKSTASATANSIPHAVAPYAAALAFATGMRSGEIKGLRLGDLHHESAHPFLYVRRATTKTDAGARRVVLDRIAVWAARKLVARAHLLGCRSPEDY